MIESPAAILDIASIARRGRAAGLEALVLGPNYPLSNPQASIFLLGRMVMQTMVPMSVIAAARAGLAALDGVCNDFRNLEASLPTNVAPVPIWLTARHSFIQHRSKQPILPFTIGSRTGLCPANHCSLRLATKR
ncbi:MAG: hypothetical protein R3D34_16370 [Nitratireductor sp.]